MVFVMSMALYDDRRFLLSHIHHSFVTCDETGMCEMVMLNEVIPPILPGFPKEEIDELVECESNGRDPEFENSEVAQSYDIVSDMELIGAHRRRSNTAQRLDRLKKERKNQAKVKVIQWKEPSQPLTAAKLAELFPKKPIVKMQSTKKSTLADLLEKYPAAPSNPFSEYARFDGKVSEGIPVKRILIYLTMLPQEQQNYPMEVVTLTSAKVQDLIGLICWQYTNEKREPKLNPDISNYCLRIAEENGEVDPDFPSLDPKELVAKFGFPVLALVEKEKEPELHVVTIHIEDMCSQIQVSDLKVTLREILDQTLQTKKGLIGSKDLGFRIVKYYDMWTTVNIDATLEEAGTLEFSLIWHDGSEGSDHTDDWAVQDMTAMEAPLYQSYTVSMIQKLGKNIEVQLGISGEKVEINPLPQKGTAKLWTWQQKAVTYNVDRIAACELISRKYNVGKAVFKLIYCSGNDYKSHVFETDSRRAQEIVKKVQYILEIHTSDVQREYQVLKERKMQRKSSHATLR